MFHTPFDGGDTARRPFNRRHQPGGAFKLEFIDHVNDEEAGLLEKWRGPHESDLCGLRPQVLTDAFEIFNEAPVFALSFSRIRMSKQCRRMDGHKHGAC